ncbi:MAG: hypothetical protein KAI02_03315 [Gammaproteobacteria bacterium]|nr:hypothetical protein [Gammaproteobacteria bacterium]
MSSNKLIKQLNMHSEELYQLWLMKKENDHPESNPEILKEAYHQLCLIIERIDTIHNAMSQDELNEIANHGIKLHIESVQWVEKLQATSIAPDIMKSIILFSAWAGRHHCELDEIEVIVNFLGEYSNFAKGQEELEELAHLSMDIIDACPMSIKQDMDNNNPGRPWRVLLFNNAIIATRSHQDPLMEQAYELIGEYLPNDAPSFFAQALEQMDIIGYPDNVRIIVRRYFELWNNSTQH